jgi:transcriptional regulator with XRE-family HTH domain
LQQRKTFAVLVRTFRGAVGWSQQELADQLGLSKASIAKLELGIMRLTPENKAALLKLMKATGIKFEMSPTSLSIVVNKDVPKKLDAKRSLSLPRRD